MSEYAQAYERNGKVLTCPICDGQKFWLKEAQLNTKVASFFDFDWLNPSGECYICKECRHIIWFYGESERLGPRNSESSQKNPFRR